MTEKIAVKGPGSCRTLCKKAKPATRSNSFILLFGSSYLVLVTWFACGRNEAQVIRPELAFTISTETGLTTPRDLTVDDSGNILVFDYGNYRIRKFSPSGEILAAFGGPDGVEGGFRHLMAIRAPGDSIMALDAGALLIFDSSGQLRAKHGFTDTVICDLPRLHTNGEWAGEWIVEETAQKVLTHRKADGQQLSRIAEYDLADYFPGIRPAEMFFIKPTQLPAYLYDFLPDGRLVWAASDTLRILSKGDQEESLLYSADWEACPFPAETVKVMKEQQASLNPPLFMNVPENYQLIHHLLVDEAGDLWMYLKSLDRTGFLHLSENGSEKGFHVVEADFDPLAVRIAAAHGRLYFMLADENETRIYVAERP